MKQKKRGSRGFTMAELLIVVAIIGILSGVAFAAVQQHQRSLAQVERNTIAKELYFAAQNHLAMAYAQGYLGVDNYGEESGDGNGVYYLVHGAVSTGDALNFNPMLEIMLPFGAIDETVRAGGSYLIRYQPSTATVLDVFYCSTVGSPAGYNHKISKDDYSAFMGYAHNDDGTVKDKATLPGSGYVVGWYGGAEAGESGIFIEAPTVTIDNGDKLTATITCPDYSLLKDSSGAAVNPTIELIISGERHEDGKIAKAVIKLASISGFMPDERVELSGTQSFIVTLDDITTSGRHFVDLNDYNKVAGDTSKIWFMPDDGTTDEYTDFRPGENITVEAVAFSNSVLSNIAYSSAQVTNSLFADIVTGTGSGSVASATAEDHSQVRIASFRHLENLDAAVSDYQPTALTDLSEGKEITATQIYDLDWTAFADDTTRVFKKGDDVGTEAGCYLPVSPDYKLKYLGQQHEIKNVKANHADDAGLFGGMTAGGSISDLKLTDFSVASTGGSAGALAGALTDVQVSNVVASHTPGVDGKTITAAGSAGGLIGSLTGGGVEKSAAALIVRSTGGNAGGLIGTATGAASVTASYSGGHTVEKALGDGTVAIVYDDANYNVTANGVAGGLIGSAADIDIAYSYSTCSATGATAGGLVGAYAGAATNSIADCYATGRVKATGTEKITVGGEEKTVAKEGAFAYSIADGPEIKNCLFYEIVNERPVKDDDGNTIDYEYLPGLGGGKANANITALDASVSSYNAFVPGEWQAAQAYNTKLKDYYGDGKYPLKTVSQLGATIAPAAEGTTGDFVATHYGDWPMPETFVINVKSTT